MVRTWGKGAHTLQDGGLAVRLLAGAAWPRPVEWKGFTLRPGELISLCPSWRNSYTSAQGLMVFITVWPVVCM